MSVYDLINIACENAHKCKSKLGISFLRDAIALYDKGSIKEAKARIILFFEYTKKNKNGDNHEKES